MEKRIVKISAKPAPILVDLAKTAVVVVDAQNAFLSKGGMFDILGYDLLNLRCLIKPLTNVLDVSRKLGFKIIYIRHTHAPDLSDTGNADSPYYWKARCSVLARQSPELKEKLLIKGTWGAEIINELKPMAGDVIIDKQRYSGFVNTDLEKVLSHLKLKYLFFTGVALNICVESTVRDAFHREFWPIVISDCCEAVGPKYSKKATLWNISRLFGWITTSRIFTQTLLKREQISGVLKT